MKKHRILVKKDDPEICIKVPQDLYQELIMSADHNHRSENTEVLIRLVNTLENEEVMATDKLLRDIFRVGEKKQ